MRSLTHLEFLLPELRAYARSLSETPDSAEDLVQGAIERSLRSPNTPRKLADLRPWIFRVIRNLNYDELRKRRIRREYATTQKRSFSDEGGIPDHARDVLVRLSYERLPPDKREVLLLVDILGLKYLDAANIMGVAPGTVMSRLSRARQALREMIGTSSPTGATKQSGTRGE